MTSWLLLIPLAIAGFLHNVTKVWTARAQTSADVNWARKATYAVNAAWFLTQVFVFSQLWSILTGQNWYLLAATFVVYTISTSEGAVAMMKWLLQREKGKRRVGAKPPKEKTHE
jgi:hypothetical protein